MKFFIYTLFFITIICAGTTGKLSGIVYDADTKEPIVGCNVIVQNSDLGTATDEDGYFFIMNISPGPYDIRFSMIGYSDCLVNKLEVNSDLTTALNVPMELSALSGEEVVITADENKINKNLTSTTAIVSSKVIDKLPINEVSEIVGIQAGFVDGHLRGGRSGEVAYWVDGIPMTDQYDGNSVIDVSKDMVQEMQLISGAFNAEYGQAMSGVLNIVTKEGSEDFGGSINLYSGDFLTDNSNIFMNADSFSPLNTKNIGINLHGKILKNNDKIEIVQFIGGG